MGTFSSQTSRMADVIADRLGAPATYRRVTRGAFDKPSGVTAQTTADTAITVVRDGSRAQRGSQFSRMSEQVMFKVKASEAAFSTYPPGINDQVVQGGTVYRIVNAEMIAATAMWRLTCERTQ